MLIVASIYCFLVWLVFFKLKLMRWNRTSGTVVTLIGLTLLLIVVGLLNFYTPSGRIVMMGRVVEIAPNVAGRVTKIFIQRNQPVGKGEPIFQIDARPFEYEVARLEAALVEAQSNVKQLAASVEEAKANVAALQAQVKLGKQKRRDIRILVERNVKPIVELDRTVTQLEALVAELQAAQSREMKARVALGSTIDGEQSSVAQIKAQLDRARWELEETTIHAPMDGYASGLTLAIGNRASPLRSVIAFIDADGLRINGVFSQNGFRSIVPGAKVKFALSSRPGVIHDSHVLEVFRGIGQGQVPVSAQLPNIGSIGMSQEYGVRIAIPESIPPEAMRLGMSGTATVFAEDAGPIGMLAFILLWFRAQFLFL